MTKEKLQQKYILYQLLAQNMESLKQQMQMVEQQLMEVKTTILSIDDVKGVDDKNEVLIPLGSGCYGKGKVIDKNDIMVNVGMGIFVNKNSASSKSYLNERVKELENAGEEIERDMKRVANQINEIGAEIQELAREKGKS